MVSVFVADKLDSEVINYKCEGDGSPHMPPEPWRELARVVSGDAHAFYDQVIGYPACDRDSIHPAFDADMYPSVTHHVVQLVLVNDFLWDYLDW